LKVKLKSYLFVCLRTLMSTDLWLLTSIICCNSIRNILRYKKFIKIIMLDDNNNKIITFKSIETIDHNRVLTNLSISIQQ